MKFHSTFSEITYIVRPQDIEIKAGRPTTTKGLRAEFHKGRFNSESAQKSLGWTEEDRETVEKYLVAHVDHGKSLSVMDIKAIADEAETQQVCLAMYVVAGESQSCGRPCTGDFCPEHAAEFVEEEETASV